MLPFRDKTIHHFFFLFLSKTVGVSVVGHVITQLDFYQVETQVRFLKVSARMLTLMTSTELGFPEGITCESGEETSLRSSTWSLRVGFGEATMGGGWGNRRKGSSP